MCAPMAIGTRVDQSTHTTVRAAPGPQSRAKALESAAATLQTAAAVVDSVSTEDFLAAGACQKNTHHSTRKPTSDGKVGKDRCDRPFFVQSKLTDSFFNTFFSSSGTVLGTRVGSPLRICCLSFSPHNPKIPKKVLGSLARVLPTPPKGYGHPLIVPPARICPYGPAGDRRPEAHPPYPSTPGDHTNRSFPSIVSVLEWVSAYIQPSCSPVSGEQLGWI